MKPPSLLTVTILMAFVPALLGARQDPSPGTFAATGIPPVPLPSEPVIYDTAEGQRIRVRVIADGLRRPWGLALLPDDRMLVTEREGSLRLIHQGVLDPMPIHGVPEVFTGVSLAGLMDVEVHPGFAENRWVYLTYSKPTQTGATIALARGRFDGHRLSEVTDLFIADADGPGIAASRLLFGPDGLLYMTVGGAINAASTGKLAQDPGSGQSHGQGPAPARRWHRPARQSDGRPAGVSAGDLLAGPSQPTRPGISPRDRDSVGQRERPDGWRRSQYHLARQKLRVARGVVWAGVLRRTGE